MPTTIPSPHLSPSRSPPSTRATSPIPLRASAVLQRGQIRPRPPLPPPGHPPTHTHHSHAALPRTTPSPAHTTNTTAIQASASAHLTLSRRPPRGPPSNAPCASERRAGPSSWRAQWLGSAFCWPVRGSCFEFGCGLVYCCSCVHASLNWNGRSARPRYYRSDVESDRQAGCGRLPREQLF